MLLLVSCKLPEVFRALGSPSMRQISNPHACIFSPVTKPRMRISSPGTLNFPGNSLFQLFQKSPMFPLIREKKGVILGWDEKVSSPGSPYTTLSTSIRFVQAVGQSFSAIFTLHSSCSSLYRVTEMLSRIKYTNRGKQFS